MTFKWNLALNKDLAITFNESFENESNPAKEINGWAYKTLTKVGTQWAGVLANGGFNCETVNTDGEAENTQVKLSEFKLSDYAPKSNSKWSPENLDEDNSQTIELQMGSKLEERVKNVITIQRYLNTKKNESILKYQEANPDKIEDEKLKKGIAKIKESIEKYKGFPLEKFLWDLITPEIIKKTIETQEKEQDAEFEELYAEKSESK